MMGINNNESKIINGKNYSRDFLTHISDLAQKFENLLNRKPCLAVILIGDNNASKIYVKNKILTAKDTNIKSIEILLSKNTSECDLLNEIYRLNNEEKVDGILVQLPLPNHIQLEKVVNSISPKKDVDGFHPQNFGNLMLGNDTVVPCTPLGCWYMLKKELNDLTGYHALVIGRSNIVGKPMQSLLIKENCTVTIAHSKSKRLAEISKKADIIIAAIGRPEFITREFIKSNSVIIDVGINRNDKKLVGDVKFEDALKIAKKVTPVPGGVGPMTIACLMYNTVKLAYRRNNQMFKEILY